MICANEVINAVFDTIITKAVDCPECFKQHANMDYRYVDIYHKDIVVARVALGIMGSECLLHGVVEQWSRESLRAIKTGFFSAIIPVLRKLGVKKIAVIEHSDKSEKLMKFLKMLHFTDPIQLTYTEMEI